jgi:hypothetical protein
LVREFSAGFWKLRATGLKNERSRNEEIKDSGSGRYF